MVNKPHRHRRVRAAVHPPAHRLRDRVYAAASKGVHTFHASYFGSVAYEAHGFYRWLALACLVCIAASFFLVHVLGVEAAGE